MSIFYKESNFENSRELFDKSVVYKLRIGEFSTKYSNIVDFNFAEKYMYGRVDRNFVSIELNEKLVSFSTIKNSADTANVRVLNFVADGFQELSRQFVKAAQVGSIRGNDPYLSNLLAYDGYQRPSSAYATYANGFLGSIKNTTQAQQINFRDFHEFASYLIKYISTAASTFPFTKTGFIKSRFTDSLMNGLTIEVADLSFTNDEQKINLFVNSPNFEYYLNACNSFGFMVDAASPWKITLDIGHEDVIETLMKPRGFASVDSLLLVGYKKTHLSYYRNFKKQLFNMYNQVANRPFTEFESCNGITKTKIITPKRYTNEQFNNLYNEDYFIKLYCMFRFIEEEKKHSQAEQDHIITDFVNLSRIKGVNYALGSFERFISQPFDYRGSLSYLNRALSNREDQ